MTRRPAKRYAITDPRGPAITRMSPDVRNKPTPIVPEIAMPEMPQISSV
jgi:hypothetical protein